MFAFLMGLKSISPRELLQRIEARQQPVTVIDVNSAQSWTRLTSPVRCIWIHRHSVQATCRWTNRRPSFSIVPIHCAAKRPAPRVARSRWVMPMHA